MGLFFHLLPSSSSPLLLLVHLRGEQSAECRYIHCDMQRIFFRLHRRRNHCCRRRRLFTLTLLSKQIKRETFCLYYINTCIHAREYIGEWVSLQCIYTSSVYFYKLFFSLKNKKRKQTFWLLLCQFATPNSGLLTRISNFLFTLLFVPFVCWLVRSSGFASK